MVVKRNRKKTNLDIEEIKDTLEQETISIDKETIKEENSENDNVDENTSNKKKFKKWKLVLFFIVISLFILLLGFILFPRIELKGRTEIEISYKDKYIEAGYDLFVLNKKIPNKIKVNSNIKVIDNMT